MIYLKQLGRYHADVDFEGETYLRSPHRNEHVQEMFVHYLLVGLVAGLVDQNRKQI